MASRNDAVPSPNRRFPPPWSVDEQEAFRRLRQGRSGAWVFLLRARARSALGPSCSARTRPGALPPTSDSTRLLWVLAGFNDGVATRSVYRVLFGFISRVRMGVRFAVDMSLPFTVWVRELKIPRTPDRRITPPFGSATFGSWPARALTIFAHIPVPFPSRENYPGK